MFPLIIFVILLLFFALTQSVSAATISSLKKAQAESNKVNTALKVKVEKNAKVIKQLEKENTDLKAKRQAKLDALNESSQPTIGYVAVSGTCSEWLASAGVSDTYNAMWLINKESGCNPNSVNPYSGACGVAQELPCGKSGCKLGDGVCQIAWMQRYVFARYGSWAGAVSFHLSHGWY